MTRRNGKIIDNKASASDQQLSLFDRDFALILKSEIWRIALMRPTPEPLGSGVACIQLIANSGEHWLVMTRDEVSSLTVRRMREIIAALTAAAATPGD